ncbi:MAG: S41 family peptidase [Candidatus Omnitrophota bacterium]
MRETDNSDYRAPYIKLLDEVFRLMDENYYKPVSRPAFDAYVRRYKTAVLDKLKERNTLLDNIAYRGAGLLVNKLKDPDDKFSNFIPPDIAKKYAEKVYGFKRDIGIAGHITEAGYLIDHVQIRSDSYAKGIRASDIIKEINGDSVTALDNEAIELLLTPELETVTRLLVFSPDDNTTKTYEILCEEYFRETVKSVPTGIPGAYIYKIESFNRKTSDDLKNYIAQANPDKTGFIILDVRDNPGGPPLAVYELSGIFMPPKQKLFYYKKKNQPEFGLISPDSDVHYGGPLVILIDRMSGSASEIMAVTFKAYGRAVIAGKEPSAGMAFLKGTFKLEDGSMLALITGNAFLFDGTEIDIKGVEPDLSVPADIQDAYEFLLDKYRDGEFTHE